MDNELRLINIIIADDHGVVREGICSIIEKQTNMHVVAEANNGLQLLQFVEQYHPTVVMTDIRMPVMGGLEATTLLYKKYPGLGIIALTMFDDDKLIFDMLEAGARGYLLKNAHKDEIIEAIQKVANGQTYYSKDITGAMTRLIAESRYGKNKMDRIEFSANELKVINLLCRQFSTKEISIQLHLSPRTIEGYRESILKKIDAKNTVGIVRYAIANKLFDVDDPENKL